MSTEFGKKLKELREANRYTQQQIATSLGVTVRQVQRYEEGAVPRPVNMKKLNKIFRYDFYAMLDDIERHVDEPEIPYKASSNDSREIIASLTRSLETMTSYTQELVKNNSDLVRNNTTLVDKVVSSSATGLASPASPGKAPLLPDPTAPMRGKSDTDSDGRKGKQRDILRSSGK